jgi:hypothetical protein
MEQLADRLSVGEGRVVRGHAVKCGVDAETG